MIVSIAPGDTLLVQFLDDEHRPTDGEFKIEYSPQGNEIKVSESAGLPGSIKGGASELLYHEKGALFDDMDDADTAAAKKALPEGAVWPFPKASS